MQRTANLIMPMINQYKLTMEEQILIMHLINTDEKCDKMREIMREHLIKEENKLDLTKTELLNLITTIE